jgi:RHS repeat-associated protein
MRLEELAAYSAYGVQTIQSGSDVTPFGFQGSYTDPSGLIYLIDRYYDPATDQFLSVDPYVAETGQPYAFTGDDPLNGTDPLGQMFTCGGQPGACAGSPSTGPILEPSTPTSVSSASNPSPLPPPQTKAQGLAWCAANRAYCEALNANKDNPNGLLCLETGNCSLPAATTSNYSYKGSCVQFIVSHCTIVTADGRHYSQWGVSIGAGYDRIYGIIYNQNGSQVTNNCVIDKFVQGWSVAGGGNVGAAGVEAVWGTPGTVDNGSGGVQFDLGVSGYVGPSFSYASGSLPYGCH